MEQAHMSTNAPTIPEVAMVKEGGSEGDDEEVGVVKNAVLI